MIWVTEHNEPLRAESAQCDTGRRMPRRNDERDIRPPTCNILDQFDGAGIAQPHLNPRVCGAKSAELRRQVDRPETWLCAYSEPAAHESANRGDRILRSSSTRQSSQRVREECLACRCELDAPRTTNEQGCPKLGLEGSNRGREAGLGDLQQISSPGEMALLRNGDEVFKLPQFH